MITGHATPEGTAEFAARSPADPDNYNKFCGLTLSNVGMGTYLGEPDSQTDVAVVSAVKQSVAAGINVIDTAINYRAQKAERAVGKAISEMVGDGTIKRQQVFVSTKNGYVTHDAEMNLDFWGYVKKEYTETGVVGQGDISPQYHCMTVPYLKDQLKRSLANLGLDCIDLMYLHNATEGQPGTPRPEFVRMLKDAFEFYESARRDGRIRFYGMATWECLRVKPDHPQYLSLADILKVAESAGGEDHGFRFVQLPFNMYYDQAYMLKNQGNPPVSVLEAAKSAGIGVFTSVPLMQGRLLAQGVMPEFGSLPPPLRALQFIRSAPGVIAPLVGQKTDQHVQENLQITKIKPMTGAEFAELVKRLVS